MGKSRHHARRVDHDQQYPGMVEPSLGDRPGTTERGSLHAIPEGGSGGESISLADRHDESRGGTDDLSQREHIVRNLDAVGVRVPRRTPAPVRRSFDSLDINPIVNDPDVFPMICGDRTEPIDLTELLLDQRNVLLVVEGGAILFNWHEPGIYEVHTNFLKEWRGRYALEASVASYRWMFTRTDCMTLLTRIPKFNRAAEEFCGMVGATKEFERAAVWPTKDGKVDMSYWALRYDDWFRRTPDLAEGGRIFHTQLDAEFERHGVERHEAHADEECHDRNVGACAEMIYGGQPEKGIALYNRWARFASYGLIKFLSRNPLVIDIGDAVLQVIEGDNFKAVLCRSPPQ